MIPKAVLASRADWTGSMQPYLQLNKLSKAVAWINGKERFLLTSKPAIETAGGSRGWCPDHLIHVSACTCTHACMCNHSRVSTMLIDIDITTGGGSSRKQHGVGACPLDSCLGICMHACARVSPCMAKGLLGLGMGASDWDSTSRLLCLLAEVRAPSTVTGALAMYKQLHMRET